MGKCSQYLKDANRYNPNRGGLALRYGSGGCSVDSYTALAYWRRRFKSQDCYLAYFVPQQRYARQFGTTKPYRANGFSLGNVCPMLYKRLACTNAQKGLTVNSGACAAGRK